MSQEVLVREAKVEGLVGSRGRVGAIGQEYKVVGTTDAATVLVEVESWDEPLRYPAADVVLDLAGVANKDRFQPNGVEHARFDEL